jgi:hypothetical protein
MGTVIPFHDVNRARAEGHADPDLAGSFQRPGADVPAVGRR